MKKIGIDCRFAGTQSGLGRYTRELTSALLSREDQFSYTLFVRDSTEPWLAHHPRSERVAICEAPFPHYSAAEQFRFPRILAGSGIDLLFVPHFNVPLRSPVPFVATIHDLTLHYYPNLAPLYRRIAYRWVMRHTVRAAAVLITVSTATAQDVQRFYGKRAAGKTTVVYEGVSDHFQLRSEAEIGRVKKMYGITRPYFLYVGNTKQHKQVQLLVDAFIPLSADHELVLVMSGSDAASLRLGDGVRVLHDVSDPHLSALYSGALSFVTASLYEGFCLPIAEARACGCPAIALPVGAIPEVAAPGSFFVSLEREAFTAAMLHPPPRPAAHRLSTWLQTASSIASVFTSVS